jgi:hypothetical protein
MMDTPKSPLPRLADNVRQANAAFDTALDAAFALVLPAAEALAVAVREATTAGIRVVTGVWTDFDPEDIKRTVDALRKNISMSHRIEL